MYEILMLLSPAIPLARDADEVHLFFLFVRSQRTPGTDPLVLCLTGGPRGSTLSAFSFEMYFTVYPSLWECVVSLGLEVGLVV
ncbi:Peptidase S10, serine carboxypeptidase [Dillenia turbinata]|uniref:Peptidase S10, serine carboxypeptidase n=1 Tax=Dillenia turbinata TaxID=194707 RepID=A0AAN8Z054_9MAGN